MVDDVVMSTLYDGEGWWNPAQSIIRIASGRTILLGGDPAKLREEHTSRNRDDLDELIKDGDTDALIKFLQDHADNVYLRQHVYDALVGENRLDACVKVTDAFAELSDPKLMDIKYRVVLSFQNNTYQSEPRAAIRRLRSYIEQHPAEPVFYLVLGAAYEESDESSKLKKARQCYSKAKELRGWGPVNRHATDALSRLGENANQD